MSVIPRNQETGKILEKGTVGFRPKARLVKSLLGDELVSDQIVSVVELVKNSYDADAKNVWINIENDSVSVTDDGHGMTKETVLNGWFQPATTFKKKAPFSKKGRPVLGNKGIGRFATARIGSLVQIRTRAEGETYETYFKLNWDQFDNEELFLDEIEYIWETVEPERFVEIPEGQVHTEVKPGAQGTYINILNLRPDTLWNKDKVEGLWNALERLKSPFETTMDFNIHVKTIFEEFNGEVYSPEVLRNPKYTLKGDIYADGVYALTYTSGDYQKELNGQIGSTRTCGNYKIELRVWDRDRRDLKEVADLFKLEIDKLREMLDKSSGVSIYRDGFRVFPYGEPGDDWLGLDSRRIQNPTLRLSNNQVVGFVQISSQENSELIDKSSREGLLNNQALRDLKESLISVFKLLEERRYKTKRPPSVDGPEPKKKANDLFAEINLEQLKTTINEKKDSLTPKDTLKIVTEANRELKLRIDRVKSAFIRYRRLASLGRLVDIILHEGRQPLAMIDNAAFLGGIEVQDNIKDPYASRINKQFTVIRGQCTDLSRLFRKIEPFSGRDGYRRKSMVAIEDVIKDAVSVFERRISSEKIQVSIVGSATTRVFSTEIQQVFINLIDNSLHWMGTLPRVEKEILIKIEAVNDSIKILYCDSGPGINQDDADRVFEPYFTTKPEGTGLGLVICGEIVAEHDGTLEISSSGTLPGACFVITLPRKGV
jgi:signal transduction histidine kinase